MAKPTVGETRTFKGQFGLGQGARNNVPDVPADRTKLRGDMADLDMAPDTAVTVAGYDDDRDLVLLAWTDSAGTPRITSVTEQDYASQFQKEGGNSGR